MNCVMGALDKIHQLIQIKAVGLLFSGPFYVFVTEQVLCLLGLHLDHDHKVRPTLTLAKA